MFSRGIAEIQCQMPTDLMGNQLTRDESFGSAPRLSAFDGRHSGFGIGSWHQTLYYYLTG